MIGAHIIARFRNDGLTLRATSKGTVVATPKARLTEEHRRMLRDHLPEILQTLEKWGGTAKARDFSLLAEPVRKEERGEIAPRFPEAITSRHPWRRGKR